MRHTAGSGLGLTDIDIENCVFNLFAGTLGAGALAAPKTYVEDTEGILAMAKAHLSMEFGRR